MPDGERKILACCEHCDFSVPSGLGGLRCHFNAPVLQIPQFPPVTPHNWCGEFLPNKLARTQAMSFAEGKGDWYLRFSKPLYRLDRYLDALQPGRKRG